MSITVARFLDVADGLQANQFSIGDRVQIGGLNDVDPDHKQLMDGQVTAVMAVMGGDGRPNLSAMWFDYDGDANRVLVNVAAHRKKTSWIRANPQITVMLMNPANPYHWMSMKCTVEREVSEDDPDEGAMVTAQLDKIWDKYTGAGGSYGLRDPSMDERRVLFICKVDRIATFGRSA